MTIHEFGQSGDEVVAEYGDSPSLIVDIQKG